MSYLGMFHPTKLPVTCGGLSAALEVEAADASDEPLTSVKGGSSWISGLRVLVKRPIATNDLPVRVSPLPSWLCQRNLLSRAELTT